MEIKVDTSDIGVALDILSRKFGDTNEQAVARWGVATARELAVKTQARGKTSAAKKTQNFAIENDAKRCVVRTKNTKIFNRLKKGEKVRLRVDGVWQTIGPDLVLKSPQEINSWINSLRNNRGRVGKVTGSRRKVCKQSDFNKAILARKKASGKAKGGWIGAGIRLGATQKGADRITIGKNFLSYAHKHKHGGYGYLRKGDNPVAYLVNMVPHAGNEYVLSSVAIAEATTIGGKATMTWYRKALANIRRTQRR